MLYIQLTQAQSQVKAPVNSINNHAWKGAFYFSTLRKKIVKKTEA